MIDVPATSCRYLLTFEVLCADGLSELCIDLRVLGGS